MLDFRVLEPRSLPQSVNIAAANGRLFMANDASFKSDTYNSERHMLGRQQTDTQP